VTTTLHALRRRLTLAGGHAASLTAIAVDGRRDEATYRPATLIDAPLRHIAVGAPLAWPGDVGFLDGTQHVDLVGYVGTQPVVSAVVRAAVRLRIDRRLRSAITMVRRVVVARAEAIAALGALPDGVEPIAIDEDDPHPLRDLQHARGMVDRTRSRLEVAAARAFRARNRERWLIIDGGISATPEWGADPWVLGVVKSHAMLPFAGEELAIYLALPRGHRTSIFMPASRRVTPLYSWALRLHDFTGHDLFHGLVRIEAPATDETIARADRLSQHLLAEVAPLSNDARADRLLYGIHDVERYLNALGR
jgi:hypothetical protein